MKRQAIESTAIASFGYDHATATLELEYRSHGTVYQYFDVPPSVVTEIEARVAGSGSVGEFVAKNVRGRYRFQKV